ncbi:hypothetical protein NEUTE1DRAFT_54505 [Neurospora tetrasperma FGSC 2508]|uniref:Secreted protein n=1 Tax=Neurospora tetrasperma (strain FGSC 2508 / ATCC MYA-4615 / P0657) TaxID=510951 RepID=F8N3G0_NEUT8|nr:uncharacterized protein NEUTE1DRAFT_54505 [Neurospora tetrasperma FGSC 2508]EGO51767.1 hypothetical protein NEUTE1DRAFT_54505 [Neurospora tetrasperma FGSC 2508]
MKVSKAVAGLVSATVLFGSAPAVSADETGFLDRSHRALGKGHANKASGPDYDLYGGYTPEEKVYSYPPYGYHPPPPPPFSLTTSAFDEPTTITSQDLELVVLNRLRDFRDRCVRVKCYHSSLNATPYYELIGLNEFRELRHFSGEPSSFREWAVFRHAYCYIFWVHKQFLIHVS